MYFLLLYSPSLLNRLLHLCGGMQVTHHELAKRILAEKYSLAATWRRGGCIVCGFILGNSLRPDLYWLQYSCLFVDIINKYYFCIYTHIERFEIACSPRLNLFDQKYFENIKKMK